METPPPPRFGARIAIVGAGIAGLTAALALQRAGFEVRLFERAAALGDVGAGLTITPNGTHVFHSLGLRDWILAHTCRPEASVVKHWQSGEVVAWNTRRSEIERAHGAEMFQVHRADLHAELARRVLANDPAAIRLEHDFARAQRGASAITAVFAGGGRASCDVLLGADGIRSVVRADLFGAGSPQFTGYVAWRGLVPVDALPGGATDFDSCAYRGPGYLFLRYLVRRRELLNFVCIGRAPGWTEEGWAVPASAGQLLGLLEGWHPDVRDAVARTPGGQMFKWGLFHRPPLERWHEGRIALIGDAAHPMLPFLGQGAVMAIEDAGILGRAFSASASPEEALARYESARRERANAVLQQSAAMGRLLIPLSGDHYTQQTHVSAGTLGLLDYNPRTVPV